MQELNIIAKIVVDIMVIFLKMDHNQLAKGIPLCGVLGGGYNKDFDKLVELHSFLHRSCAKLL